MKNKMTRIWVRLVVGWVLLIQAAYAEIPIQNDNEIAGSWLMESASQKLDGPRVSRSETWTIGGGELEKTGLLLARSGTYDVPPVDYQIKDGKLWLAVVGRSGKFDVFSLIERSTDAMILYGKSDGYLYFKRK